MRHAAVALALVVFGSFFALMARADCESYTGEGQKPMFAPAPTAALEIGFLPANLVGVGGPSR
jgi:hypothetical protein